MKPILFNTDMVLAILGGRKTQTRRIVKAQLTFPCQCMSGFYFDIEDQILRCKSCNRWLSEKNGRTAMLPQHCTGDILYVRETWRAVDYQYIDGEWSASVQFKDKSIGERVRWKDGDDTIYECTGWHPSIHMPKEAARIFLKVTDVRMERLQNIDDEGAKAEGAFLYSPDFIPTYHYKPQETPGNGWITARDCFLWGIWDKTLKKADREEYDHRANPWVWVYEFEVKP